MAKAAKVKIRVSTQPVVVMESEVARKIRLHARSSMKSEVCGVLLGSTELERMTVEACIAGVNAAQAGAHVTFTQSTWAHIYKIKDRDFPELKIVGWYHSHPGFGVFLTDHDLFIQQNYFSNPQQVAWVYDPQTDEEGCFGWVGGNIEKLTAIRVGYSQAVEITSANDCDDEGESDDTVVDSLVRSHRENEPEEPAWFRWTRVAMGYVTAIVLGFLLCFAFLNWRLGPTMEKARRYEELIRVPQQQRDQQGVSGATASGQDVQSQAAPAVAGHQQPSRLPQKAPAEKGSNSRH